jgi:ribonucleoside-triphosphate reductase
MIDTILKRDGRVQKFDGAKIVNAIAMAGYVDEDTANLIAAEIQATEKEDGTTQLAIEEIQDMVELKLVDHGYAQVALEYARYRQVRKLVRENEKTYNGILDLVDSCNKELNEENSNKNPTLASTQRDYTAGEVSKDLTMRLLLPPDIANAHRLGLLHFHDSDYFLEHIFNCCLVNLGDMLQNGTVINGTKIDPPKSFATACTVATQIIACVASNQYGGQTVSVSHLAPFVRVSKEKHRQKTIAEWTAEGFTYTDEQLEAATMSRLKDEIKDGVQTIQYQINTLMTTNGQTPFVSVFMYLSENPEYVEETAMIIEEMLKQRILGTKNEVGVYITPAFPKLLYVLEPCNMDSDGKYYYLSELASECVAKRMVPDFISAKQMRKLKEGYVFPCMGCRSFLAPWKDENGNVKFYGRFNEGVVTINLPDVALTSGGDEEKFWQIMEERLDLCYRALMIRHNRLKGTLSDVSPTHWQYGAIARLQKHEPIDSLLYGGYASISLGYGGLCECVRYMTGESNTSEKGSEFAKRVMRCLNEHCEIWKAQTNLGFSVYGTPMESTTYRFAKCLRERFGVIEGVTDKNYITNSYHVSVTEEIDAFSKLSFEADFQELSLGGCISYVEVPDLQGNLEAVMTLMKYIYENIMYAEINSKSDYCHVCGFDGEILIDDDMQWYCPNCGNRDTSRMTVTRRTCGYLGQHYWNYGRSQEIKERVLHL